MKKFLFLFLLNISLFSFSFGQGINFFKGTYEEALVKAKKENKNIFVDVYTSWCGPCKMMASKVFTDKEVGNYFNKHFVSIKLDAEKEKSSTFFKKYTAGSYPSFFFLDANGSLLDKQGGYNVPDAFIAMAKKAVKSNVGKRMAELKKRWDAGEKTEQLFNEYVLRLLPIVEPENVRKEVCSYLKSLPAEQLHSIETFDKRIFRQAMNRDGRLADDFIGETFKSDFSKFVKYYNKYDEDINGIGMTMYRFFVRFPLTKVSVKEQVDYLKSINIDDAEVFGKCMEIELLLKEKKFTEAIDKMIVFCDANVAEYPLFRMNFIYSLILNDYFVLGGKENFDKVEKIIEDNLKLIPCKASVMYYAVFNYFKGDFNKTYTALANKHFYPGKDISNAIFRKMKLADIRKQFPISSAETEAELKRVKALNGGFDKPGMKAAREARQKMMSRR